MIQSALKTFFYSMPNDTADINPKQFQRIAAHGRAENNRRARQQQPKTAIVQSATQPYVSAAPHPASA